MTKHPLSSEPCLCSPSCIVNFRSHSPFHLWNWIVFCCLLEYYMQLLLHSMTGSC